MGAAIFAFTLGAMLIYSGLKGEGLLDIFQGTTAPPLDPHGGTLTDTPTTDTNTTVGASPGGDVLGPKSGFAGHQYAGPNAQLLAHLEYAASHQFGLTITSRDRTAMLIGHPDYHNANRAFDASGPVKDRIAYAHWAVDQYGSQLLELFCFQAHITWKNGKNMWPAVYDTPTHVHTAA